MDEGLHKEAGDLTESWMRHDHATLRDYLVADVEDPRINAQSILTRHFLLEQLWPGRFAALKVQELRFSNVMNWVLALLKKDVGTDGWQAVHNALLTGQEMYAGVKIPAFLRETFAQLPAEVDGVTVGDYVSELLLGPGDATAAEPVLAAEITGTFETFWREWLATQEGMSISVLEAACGSANDYRYWHTFGLARFLSYAGIDICPKNIDNARQMFPDVYFETGNAMAIDVPDKTFDYIVAHDLFEHLSLRGMEKAIAEVCRVAQRGLCIGFFNLHEGPEHHVKKVRDYHWNRLSIPRLTELFARHGGKARFIHIDTLLREQFGFTQTHNKEAYTAHVTLT